jgi:serine protease AprX
VIAVGAMDDAGTVGSSDDTVPDWSTRGTDARHVDVVAPGVSVLGLRVPGGTADSENPQARVGTRFARASGTSQATAVVSGEVALLLQQNPYLTPDQVKQLVMNTASGIASTLPIFGGSGLVNLRAVLTNPVSALLKTVTGLLGNLLGPAWGSGTGSLEAARGSLHLVDGTTALSGEVDVFGQRWNGSTWAWQTSGRNAWSGGFWRGERLTGDAWQSGVWPTATWTATDWGGESFASDGWTAHSWQSDDWSAHSWQDEDWSAHSWQGEDWSAHSWQGVGWF